MSEEYQSVISCVLPMMVLDMEQVKWEFERLNIYIVG
jgi:hypothetical protein